MFGDDSDDDTYKWCDNDFGSIIHKRYVTISNSPLWMGKLCLTTTRSKMGSAYLTHDERALLTLGIATQCRSIEP